MKTLITACAAVAALALFAGSAQAGGCGYGGYNYGHGHGHVYVQPYVVQPHAHWHDTSHWDYVPPTIINHGCHQHVIPGGYRFHQTGHFDYHW